MEKEKDKERVIPPQKKWKAQTGGTSSGLVLSNNPFESLVDLSVVDGLTFKGNKAYVSHANGNGKSVKVVDF